MLPGPSSGSSSSSMPAAIPGSMSRSRRRSTVCHAFGDNLRRLGNRGGKPSVGEQSRDDPNGNGSAAKPDQNSVWSDWQGEEAVCMSMLRLERFNRRDVHQPPYQQCADTIAAARRACFVCTSMFCVFRVLI